MRTRLAPWAKSSCVGELEGEERSGATATSAQPPSMQNAATRSPGLTAAPAGAARTTPPTSLPGMNGSVGLDLVLAAGLEQLGERHAGGVDLDQHPLPRASAGWLASGSGTSTTRSASRGPVSSTIWTAFIDAAP